MASKKKENATTTQPIKKPRITKKKELIEESVNNIPIPDSNTKKAKKPKTQEPKPETKSEVSPKKGRLEKGSTQAFEWGAKMRALKQAKREQSEEKIQLVV